MMTVKEEGQLRIEETVRYRGRTWKGTIYVDAEGDTTSALVALEGPNQRATGYGAARRMPTDKPEPRVGRRFAIARAVESAASSLKAQGVMTTAHPDAAGWSKLFTELGSRSRRYTALRLNVRLEVPDEDDERLLFPYSVTGSPAARRRARNVLAKAGVSFAEVYLSPDDDEPRLLIEHPGLLVLKTQAPREFYLLDQRGRELRLRG